MIQIPLESSIRPTRVHMDYKKDQGNTFPRPVVYTALALDSSWISCKSSNISPTVLAELNAPALTAICVFFLDSAICNLRASCGSPTEDRPHWSSVQSSSGVNPVISSIASNNVFFMLNFSPSSNTSPRATPRMNEMPLLINGSTVELTKAEKPTVRTTK